MPKAVSGAAEWFQRATVRLTVPLDGFSYDAALGSRLRELDDTDPDFESKALACAQEALRTLPGVEATDAQLKREPYLSVIFSCAYGEEETEIEVKM